MKPDQRKAAIAAYKKRVAPAGIFAFTCAATGESWIGASTDLDKIENRHRFSLRAGGHQNRPLQQAWTNYGEAAFAFEVLAVLKDEEQELALTRDRRLKELLADRAGRLGATAL